MSIVTDVHRRIDRLADQLTADGNLADQSWRAALHAAPRHNFAPVRGYAMPGHDQGPQARAIDRDNDSPGWWEAVYGDMAIVTQKDDGAADPASPAGTPTCSLSAPSVVFPFLELLAPQRGQRILEIGTGTGWTAALLSDRVGEHAVTSIEVDPALAEIAAGNLKTAGYGPRLIVGDGAEGDVASAPFDGIHVTCGVTSIPHAWIRQLRPGGAAVLPWMPDGRTGYRVRLVASDGGTATGTLHGPAGYMMLRSQRGSEVLWRPHHAAQAEATTTTLDPREIISAGPGAELAITAAVPGLLRLARVNDDGSLSLLLSQAANPDGAWAACDSAEASEHQVIQYGERRLWDETEAAYREWVSQGSPGPERYLLTVTPEGQDLRLRNPVRRQPRPAPVR